MRLQIPITILATLCIFGIPRSSTSVEVQMQSVVEVQVEAEEMQHVDDEMHAHGNVVLQGDGIRIEADSMILKYDEKSADGVPAEVDATGSVVLQVGNELLRFERLNLNLRTGRGQFELNLEKRISGTSSKRAKTYAKSGSCHVVSVGFFHKSVPVQLT